MAPRDSGHESDVLLRQLDRHLAGLRARRAAVAVDPAQLDPAQLDPAQHDPAMLDLAIRIDATLRRLIADTAVSSAADRARVRAAVHCFVLRRDPRRERRGTRTLAETAQVIDEILRSLGRADLSITAAAALA